MVRVEYDMRGLWA